MSGHRRLGAALLVLVAAACDRGARAGARAPQRTAATTDSARAGVAPGGTARDGAAVPLATLLRIGSSEQSLPPGVVEDVGVPLDSGGPVAHTVWIFHRGDEQVLVLTRDRDPESEFRPPPELRAVQAVPALAPGDTLVIGECSFKGVDDLRLSAVGPTDGAQGIPHPKHAWRADTRAERFVPVDPARVLCAGD